MYRPADACQGFEDPGARSPGRVPRLSPRVAGPSSSSVARQRFKPPPTIPRCTGGRAWPRPECSIGNRGRSFSRAGGVVDRRRQQPIHPADDHEDHERHDHEIKDRVDERADVDRRDRAARILGSLARRSMMSPSRKADHHVLERDIFQ